MSFRLFINACSAIMSDMEGNLTIIAADGVVTQTQYKDIGKIYNDMAGILLWACDQQDRYGIIDWHGNTVLPFEYSGKYGFNFNEFGTLLLIEGYPYDSPADVYTVQYE